MYLGLIHVWSIFIKFPNFFFVVVVIYFSRRQWFSDHWLFIFVPPLIFLHYEPDLHLMNPAGRSGSYIKVEGAVFISSPAQSNSALKVCHHYI